MKLIYTYFLSNWIDLYIYNWIHVKGKVQFVMEIIIWIALHKDGQFPSRIPDDNYKEVYNQTAFSKQTISLLKMPVLVLAVMWKIIIFMYKTQVCMRYTNIYNSICLTLKFHGKLGENIYRNPERENIS